MGAIKDGTVSGFLPSAEAFGIHYPGYPSSMARAIETLKGTEGIIKARSLQSNKLELYFRPEDPYSHPAFGELRPCNNFLLKISKKKSSDGQSADASASRSRHLLPAPIISGNGLIKPESDSVIATKEIKMQMPEEDQINLCADIVARVTEAYHFDGMVDYQHVIPVHAEVARRKKRNWTEAEEPQSDKVGVMDMDQEDVMILVPPLFSHKDVPEKIVLRPPGTLSSKKKQEGDVQHCWEMDIEPCLAIDFNIKEIPKKVNWEEFLTQRSEQWEWQIAVSKLFDEKPIWLKDSLAEQLLDKGLDIGDRMLRRLLFRTAYYFSNGPFLRFWIRKGYDPRKDPESRIYQRIDFRVPPSLRSHCDAGAAVEVKHRWEDICAFRVFPYKCQTSFQLFELADDYIQQEIRKPSKQTSCSCGTGWFPPHVLDCLRLRVMVRFLSVYPQTGAKNLLKSASERFEKLKRMRIYNSASKPDEQGHEQINREPMGNEDIEEPEIVSDGKEDEFEIDNEEEELDAYEALDLVGEDGEISLQSHSYLNAENISRTYLQDLFGSFPTTDPDADKIQDAETSDGEYQIYEQDSDDHYSDDDYS